MWQKNGAGKHTYSKDDIASYRESAPFAELARVAAGKTAERIKAIRQIVPA